MVGGSRAGGGSYPTLNICIDRKSYERFLDGLERNSRLVHSVVFQSSPSEKSPWPTPTEAYMLQGIEVIRRDLI